MIRLLLDQGLPRSAAVLLRDEGWDVQHVGERGMSDAPDDEILVTAAREQRIIVTLDADFQALLAVSGVSRPSVIRLRIEGMKGAALAAVLMSAWPKIGGSLERGAMVTMSSRGIRIKHLPV